MSEWIEWDGSRACGPAGEVTHIRLRNGKEFRIEDPSVLAWIHVDGKYGREIIAYKLREPAKEYAYHHTSDPALSKPFEVKAAKEENAGLSASDPLSVQIGGSHYKDKPIQPVQYAMANKLGPCEFSVVKYVTRHKEKNGRQDIEKAIHFLQILLATEYPESK